jgi:hypothetical protein
LKKYLFLPVFANIPEFGNGSATGSQSCLLIVNVLIVNHQHYKHFSRAHYVLPIFAAPDQLVNVLVCKLVNGPRENDSAPT